MLSFQSSTYSAGTSITQQFFFKQIGTGARILGLISDLNPLFTVGLGLPQGALKVL